MSQRFLEQTYYEILEVAPDAPEHEIHKAYQRAKQTYSPESPALYTMFSPDEANELSRLIEEAYAVLSDYAARRDYDNRLLGRSPQETASQVKEVKKRPTSAPVPADVAEGWARTKYGTYEVDKDFEEELRKREEFDGEFLSKVRNYKKISLDDISQEIRVSRGYLRAIEENEFNQLPADVFVRGFVLQYAKALGLDGNKVANAYMKRLRNAR